MTNRQQNVQVVGLGQVCVDYVGHMLSYPVEDTKMELTSLFKSCGGPAATAMVTLSRLGMAAAFSGSIGDDGFGELIRKSLEEEGIDISALKITPGACSQFAFVAVTGAQGKRTIFWKPTSAPDPGKIHLDLFPNALFLHVDGLMLETSMEAAKQARHRNMTVVMDAGTLRQNTLELVSHVDILIASETFADPLAGKNAPWEQTLVKLKELGPRQVVITLGAKGSVGLDEDGRLIRQQPFTVNATDTTGAGDVYHGAYLYGLLQQWSMKNCMIFASAAAALKCRNGAGWSGIPRLSAVNALLNTR